MEMFFTQDNFTLEDYIDFNVAFIIMWLLPGLWALSLLAHDIKIIDYFWKKL